MYGAILLVVFGNLGVPDVDLAEEETVRMFQFGCFQLYTYLKLMLPQWSSRVCFPPRILPLRGLKALVDIVLQLSDIRFHLRLRISQPSLPYNQPHR
jgi:hypothetical protein